LIVHKGLKHRDVWVTGNTKQTREAGTEDGLPNPPIRPKQDAGATSKLEAHPKLKEVFNFMYVVPEGRAALWGRVEHINSPWVFSPNDAQPEAISWVFSENSPNRNQLGFQ
jgi:hypothetical protein